jgi:hypothetical protein
MFARKIQVECIGPDGTALPCPIAWIDNFAMRNFTNDAIFDDTLPTGDGTMEIGLRVPLDQLQLKMEDWFRRKGYLKVGMHLVVAERTAVATSA